MLKAMRRFLLSSVFAVMLVGVAPVSKAQADPLTIGSSIGLALFSAGVPLAGFTATTALVIGNIVVGAAAIGAQLLIGGQGGPSAVDPGQFKSTFENPEGPEVRAVGRVRLGGLFFFRNTYSVLTYRGVAQCRGPTDAIEEYYVGGREVVVDQTDWSVQSPPWANGPASTAYLTFQNKVGDGTETAWPQLVAYFPELWSTAHRVRGISQVLLRFRSPGLENNESYVSLYGAPGVREQIETVGRRELIYDPREGSHDIDVPTSWAWSDNGILCAVHMLRAFPSVRDNEFDWIDIALEADKADELVATKTGTERRARAWGAWGAEGRKRGEIMESMLDSIGAEITESEDGLIRIRLVDDERDPELTFTPRHVTALRLKYGPESVERPNLCRVWYYSPERNYEVSELLLTEDDGETPLAWTRYEDEIDRVGEQPFELRLPFCPSASQAQRIARRRFALERAQRGVAQLNMAGIAAWGMRVVDLPFLDVGEDGSDLIQSCLIGTPRVDDEGGEVEIPFIVQPELAAWDPETDEADPLEQVPPTEIQGNVAQPAAPDVALVQFADDSYQLRFAYTATSGASNYETSFRTFKNNDSYLPNPWTPVGISASLVRSASPGDLLGLTVEARVRGIGPTFASAGYPSEITRVEALTIDNTVPAPPVISDSSSTDGANFTINLSVAFPNELSPVRLVITREFGIAGETPVFDDTISPEEVRTVTGSAVDNGNDMIHRATFYTSDGTPSTVAQSTIVATGGGGGGS